MKNLLNPNVLFLRTTCTDSQLDALVVEELGRKSGYNIEADFWTGNIENFKNLLAAGAPLKIKTGQKNVIQLAITYGRGLEVDLLLEKGRFKIDERDEHGDTLLHYAAACSSKGCINKLIAAGAEIDAVNDLGQTPLMYAIDSGKHELALTLIDANADVNIADHTGSTPLIKAAMHPVLSTENRTAIIQALLRKQANVSASLRNGDTALSYLAMSDKNWALVDALIQRDAVVNQVNSNGLTPLMMTTANDCLQVARILILADADHELKSKAGFTFFDMASADMASYIKRVIKVRQEVRIKEVSRALSETRFQKNDVKTRKLRPKSR